MSHNELQFSKFQLFYIVFQLYLLSIYYGQGNLEIQLVMIIFMLLYLNQR